MPLIESIVEYIFDCYINKCMYFGFLRYERKQHTSHLKQSGPSQPFRGFLRYCNSLNFPPLDQKSIAFLIELAATKLTSNILNEQSVYSMYYFCFNGIEFYANFTQGESFLHLRRHYGCCCCCCCECWYNRSLDNTLGTSIH